MLRFMGLIHCVDFCSIWQNQVHLKIWSCSFSASSRTTPVTYPASTSVFNTNTDTHLLWLNGTSGSRIPAIKLEELAWFCRFESLLIRIVSNSWLLTHCSNKAARGPGSAGGTGRRRGVPQDARLPPATHQPQAALVLAASAADLKQGKTESADKNVVDPLSLPFTSIWFFSALFWVGYFLGWVLYRREKWRWRHFPPHHLPWVTVGTSIGRVCPLKILRPNTAIILWPKLLYLCYCTDPSTLQLAAAPRLAACTCAPCIAAPWGTPEPLPVCFGPVSLCGPWSRVRVSSLHKNTCCFSLWLKPGVPPASLAEVSCGPCSDPRGFRSRAAGLWQNRLRIVSF